MELEAGEVQILTGPGLTVTDRRVNSAEGELLVSALAAPRLDRIDTKVSVGPIMVMIALLFIAIGFFLHTPMLWLSGFVLLAFASVAKLTRTGLALTAEANGVRTTLYAAPSEADAKLALAAIEEALRRAKA